MEGEVGHQKSLITKLNFLNPYLPVQALLAVLMPGSYVEPRTSAVPEVTESESWKAGGAGETAGIKTG